MSGAVMARLARCAGVLLLAASCGRAPKPHGERVVVVAGAGNSPDVMYGVVAIPTGTDTLRAVRVGGADAMVHDASMTMLMELPVTAGDSLRLIPGAHHAMFTAAGALKPGDSIEVTFTFARAGAVTRRAHVVGYADLDTIFPRGK